LCAVVAADQLPVTNSGDLVSLSDAAFQSMLDAFSMHQFGQLGSILAQDGLLSAPVTLSFDQLTFKKTANNAEQVLLNGVSGVIAPGETICVLGAPDSGATLLLDLLSERMQPNVKNGDSMSGSILMNGAGGDDIEAYRRHIGYVPIGDEHLAELTVWETLQFSAMLRGSTQAEEELKQKLVCCFFCSFFHTLVLI
jgi:ABC-type uncharacterized transport system YnjBCD ATPase subunit